MDDRKIRCVGASTGRRFYADNMSQAEYWVKHGIRHARIHIGSLTFHAYILPCSIAVTFGLFKLYEKYHARITKPRTNVYSEEKSQNDDARNKASDEENLAGHAGDKDEPPQSASKLRIPVPVMVQFFYRMFTAQMIATIASQSAYQFPLTCALQAVSAFCAGIFLDKTLFRPSVSLACGWLILFLLQKLAEPFYFSLGSIAVAMLAVFAQVWSLHPKNHAPSLHAFQLNATLLVAICGDTFIGEHAWIRRCRIFDQQLWPWAVMLSFGLATDAVSTWCDTRPKEPLTIPTSLAFLKQLFRVQTPNFLSMLGGIAAIFAEMAAVWCVAGYCVACLGFRWLIIGLPATPPAIGDLSGYLAGSVSLYVFASLMYVRLAEIKKLEGTVAGKLLEARLGFEAVGWTVLVAVLLAAGLVFTVNEPRVHDVKWTCSTIAR